MIVGRRSGLADLSDHASLLDCGSHLDGSGLEVKVSGEPAATVIDLDNVASGAGIELHRQVRTL